MEKARPDVDGSVRLTVRGSYAGGRELHGIRTDIHYELRTGGQRQHLEDVQWADWDAGGRLLVATVDGRLQIRDVDADGAVTWEADEAASTPDPAPPPAEAKLW